MPMVQDTRGMRCGSQHGSRNAARFVFLSVPRPLEGGGRLPDSGSLLRMVI